MVIATTCEHRAVFCQDCRVAVTSIYLLSDLAVREGRHRGEGVPVRFIAQAELPEGIPPTGEHRTVLCDNHRVVFARNHMLDYHALREGRHRGEGVLVLVITQAELPVAIVPTGEHPAVLCDNHRVGAASNHLFDYHALRDSKNSSEGVSIIIIPKAELPIVIQPTGEHRAVLCNNHRVELARNQLLSDLTVREGDLGEGVPVRGIAQAELPVAIPPTGKHRAVLCDNHRVVFASIHLSSDHAIRKGMHRGEGDHLLLKTQAELPSVILPTDKHLAGLCHNNYVVIAASNHFSLNKKF